MPPLRRIIISLFLLSVFCSSVAYVSGQNSGPIAEAQRRRGISLFTVGDFRGAIPALKRATELDPNDAIAWDYLGRAYQGDGEVDRALEAFDRVIQLQPDNIPARMNLVSLLFYTGQASASDLAANQALAVFPKNAFMHYVIGTVKFRQQQSAVALAEADAALAIDPRFGDAFLLKSQALLSLAQAHNGSLNAAAVTARKDYLQRSVQALEDFAKLGGNEATAAYWRTQLETLRIMLAETGLPSTDKPPIHRQNEVAQKARIIAKPTPEYTDEARHNQEVGTLRISGVLGADGKVHRILVLYGLSAGLTANAVAAMQKIRFAPAQIDGKDVATYVTLEYNFNIY